MEEDVFVVGDNVVCYFGYEDIDGFGYEFFF